MQGAWLYLGEHVGVRVILQQDSGCAGVIVAGGNVQGRQPNLSLCPVVDKVGDHVLVPLLQGHSQWREPILSETRG